MPGAKERKLSNRSNMAKHKYCTKYKYWICLCVPYECISNMYEVISWQKLQQENDESCYVVFPISRVHQHMHRRSSKHYMWRKQARHVSLYLL